MRKISRLEFTFLFFVSLAAVAFLSNCGGVSSVYYDGRTCAEGITSGAEIYVTLGCSAAQCHGPLSNTNIAPDKRNVTSFNSAISRVAGMSFLTCLSNEKKTAVISALNP